VKGRIELKKLLLALLLGLGLAAQPCYAATTMLRGPLLTVTNATNATPIVLTTAANTFAVNDWVLVLGVQGTTAANGVWQCSAVTATSCTLSGSVGNVNYTQGGTIQALGATATGTSSWYDLRKCDKAYVLVYAPAGSTASINIEASPQPFGATLGVGATTPANVLTTVVNPTATGTYFSIPVMGFARVNLTANGGATTIYAVLEGYRTGSLVW
jgi:hypothetical protein